MKYKFSTMIEEQSTTLFHISPLPHYSLPFPNEEGGKSVLIRTHATKFQRHKKKKSWHIRNIWKFEVAREDGSHGKRSTKWHKKVG